MPVMVRIMTGQGGNARAGQIRKWWRKNIDHFIILRSFFLYLSFLRMCHSHHTSASPLISFSSPFHRLIFKSASFTIVPFLQGALTSVIHSLSPKAMIRVSAEEMDRYWNWVMLKRWVAGEELNMSTMCSRSQWPANQPQICACRKLAVPVHTKGLIFCCLFWEEIFSTFALQLHIL